MRSEHSTLRIELFPDDLDRFVDFYVRVLGFRLTRDRRGDESPYAAVNRGPIHIGGAKAWSPADPTLRGPPQGVEIVIEVDDVDLEAAAVTDAGWPLDAPVSEQPWGLRDFRVVDPDGYYIRVTSRA